MDPLNIYLSRLVFTYTFAYCYGICFAQLSAVSIVFKILKEPFKQFHFILSLGVTVFGGPSITNNIKFLGEIHKIYLTLPPFFFSRHVNGMMGLN